VALVVLLHELILGLGDARARLLEVLRHRLRQLGQRLDRVGLVLGGLGLGLARGLLGRQPLLELLVLLGLLGFLFVVLLGVVFLVAGREQRARQQQGQDQFRGSLAVRHDRGEHATVAGACVGSIACARECSNSGSSARISANFSAAGL